MGKKRLKVQLKRLQDDTTDDFSWEDPGDPSVSEMTSAHTSASATTQPSPNKGHGSDAKTSSHAVSAVPTQVKLQEATKRLNEMNLMNGPSSGGSNGSGKHQAYKVKARDSSAGKDAKN